MQKVSRLTLSVAICAILLLTAAVIFKIRKDAKAGQDAPKISIRNLTSSVEVLKNEYDGGTLRLTIRNIGALPILAIGARIEKVNSITVDFTLNEKLNFQLDPGAATDINLSAV